MRPTWTTIALALLALGGTAVAAPLVTLDKPRPRSLTASGFELRHAADVRLEAVGLASHAPSSFWPWSWRWLRDNEENGLVVYAWLLDGATRRPVWVMRERDARARPDSRRLRDATTSLHLEPGRYELYLYAGVGGAPRSSEAAERRSGLDRVLDYVSGSEPEQNLEECLVSLAADGLADADVERFEVSGDLDGSLIRRNRLGDSQLATAGFELDRPTALRLYGVVEQLGRDRAASDYGWIVEARTRKVVWQSATGRRPPAGGAEKNRLVDEELRLEPGRYVLYYGTDDSHSFAGFNVNPPHDPYNWGLTLLPGAGFEPAAFKPFDPLEPEPLVEFSRTGDDALLEQRFHLRQEGELHVHALGECVGGSFADLATITDLGSRRVVWEMTAANTMPAGGVPKNRRFDGLVRLPAGDYLLRYRTDDSHSFAGWNAAAPFEPEAWGVSLRPGPGFDARSFEALDRP